MYCTIEKKKFRISYYFKAYYFNFHLEHTQAMASRQLSLHNVNGNIIPRRAHSEQEWGGWGIVQSMDNPLFRMF